MNLANKDDDNIMFALKETKHTNDIKLNWKGTWSKKNDFPQITNRGAIILENWD